MKTNIVHKNKRVVFPVFHIGYNGKQYMRKHYPDAKQTCIVVYREKESIEIDMFNYYNRTPFETLLELFKSDIRYAYPLAVSVAVSSIKQNRDSLRTQTSENNKQILSCDVLTFDEEKALNSKTPDELKEVIKGYAVDGLKSNGNKSLDMLLSQLRKAQKELTNIKRENEKTVSWYRDEIKTNKKTGELIHKTVKLSQEEYDKQWETLNINLINETLDGIAFDIVQEVATYLIDAWNTFHCDGESWLTDLRTELVYKKRIVSERQYVNGDNEVKTTENSYTVFDRMYSIGNKFITNERAISEKSTSYEDLLAYDEKHIDAQFIVRMEDNNDNLHELKRMKTVISRLNLSDDEKKLLDYRYYGINVSVIDENGNKTKQFIDCPTYEELSKFTGIPMSTVKFRLDGIGKRLQEMETTKRILNARIAIDQKNAQCAIVEIEPKSGNIINRFESRNDCAKKTGISKALITFCVNGKRPDGRPCTSAKGRVFRYDSTDKALQMQKGYTYKFGTKLEKETKKPLVTVDMPSTFQDMDYIKRYHDTANKIIKGVRRFSIVVNAKHMQAKTKNVHADFIKAVSVPAVVINGKKYLDASCVKRVYIDADKAYFNQLYRDVKPFIHSITGTGEKRGYMDDATLAIKLAKHRGKNNIVLHKACNEYPKAEKMFEVQLKGTRKTIDTIPASKVIEVKTMLKEKGILTDYSFIAKK